MLGRAVVALRYRVFGNLSRYLVPRAALENSPGKSQRSRRIPYPSMVPHRVRYHTHPEYLIMWDATRVDDTDTVDFSRRTRLAASLPDSTTTVR